MKRKKVYGTLMTQSGGDVVRVMHPAVAAHLSAGQDEVERLRAALGSMQQKYRDAESVAASAAEACAAMEIDRDEWKSAYGVISKDLNRAVLRLRTDSDAARLDALNRHWWVRIGRRAHAIP